MKKRMLSVLIVLCGAIVVVLLFAQNHISGKRIADIIEEGDIDRISVEKWQVVDSELVLTGSNEYAYNGDELVHDISQLKCTGCSRCLHASASVVIQQTSDSGSVCGCQRY